MPFSPRMAGFGATGFPADRRDHGAVLELARLPRAQERRAGRDGARCPQSPGGTSQLSPLRCSRGCSRGRAKGDVLGRWSCCVFVLGAPRLRSRGTEGLSRDSQAAALCRARQGLPDEPPSRHRGPSRRGQGVGVG